MDVIRASRQADGLRACTAVHSEGRTITVVQIYACSLPNKCHLFDDGEKKQLVFERITLIAPTAGRNAALLQATR